MHSLIIKAKWDEYKLRTFMITHYRKSHWNLLSKDERRAVIAMLQNYIKKANQSENNSNANRNDNKETSNGNPQDPQA